MRRDAKIGKRMIEIAKLPTSRFYRSHEGQGFRIWDRTKVTRRCIWVRPNGTFYFRRQGKEVNALFRYGSYVEEGI